MIANRRPPVPAIECASWCFYGDGHPNEFIADDQTCRSRGTVTSLEMIPVPQANTLSAYARRFNGEPAHVCLNVFVENTDLDVPLVAAEARRLAMALLVAAEEIDELGAEPEPDS